MAKKYGDVVEVVQGANAHGKEVKQVFEGVAVVNVIEGHLFLDGGERTRIAVFAPGAWKIARRNPADD